MGKLSYKPYLWRCVLGGEIIYVLCVGYGLVAGEAAKQFHEVFFDTLPGFTWLTPGSFILGLVYVGVTSLIFGAYIVWMHNASVKS